MLDERFPGFNSLKGILSLMESIIQPPLEFNNRTSISFVIKEVSISNLFLIELIFNCPMIIGFGFSSLRLREDSVALLLLLFSLWLFAS